MRHKMVVDARKFGLMIDEVIRHFIDVLGEMRTGDEILFISEEGKREALYTVMYVEPGLTANVCSIRLEKWAKGHEIPDNESARPEPNLGRCT